jgi:hypothetical protein
VIIAIILVQLNNQKLTIMKTSNMNIQSNMNPSSSLFYQKSNPFKTHRAEIIAWAIFFGVGVSYFVATMIIAIL